MVTLESHHRALEVTWSSQPLSTTRTPSLKAQCSLGHCSRSHHHVPGDTSLAPGTNQAKPADAGGQSLGLGGLCGPGHTQTVLFALCYSLNVHVHHHAQGGVPSHGEVVPVVAQADGVQPVLHSQAAAQVQETPVQACLGEPGSRTEGVR